MEAKNDADLLLIVVLEEDIDISVRAETVASRKPCQWATRENALGPVLQATYSLPIALTITTVLSSF